MDYSDIGVEIGELVKRKQKEYGDSFGKAGEILRVLYPTGVSPDQYDDVLTLVRVIDKLFRVAHGSQGDESPWRDIVGYGLLSVARTEGRKP